MEEDRATFELIRLLDLPDGTPPDERLWRWAEAFDAWLEGRFSGYHASVGPDSHHAWREFLAFTGKAPWEVGVKEVNAYIQSLEERGLRPKTINGRLACLGSFYAYCQEKDVDVWRGAGLNPVKEAQRPRIVEYENVRCLVEEEEAALLLAARLDDSPISKRDYALILTLLETGWMAGNVRTLTWGEVKEGKREEGNRREGLPEAVGEAIRDYLEAAGRLESIRDEEYVFAPVKSHVVSERRERAEDWDGGRPLTKMRLHPLDAEVLRWRIVIKRATILWQSIETLEEACLLLKVIGQAGVNLARAIKRRKQIGALARELDLVEELLEGWV